MAKAHAECSQAYKTAISSRDFSWLADEPEDLGGSDEGPTPMELLMGAIASCMAITMRMYAERKSWPLDSVEVDVQNEKVAVEDCPGYEGDKTGKIDVITAQITLHGDLDREQRTRIAEIGGKCPVHKLVASGAHFIDELRVETSE